MTRTRMTPIRPRECYRTGINPMSRIPSSPRRPSPMDPSNAGPIGGRHRTSARRGHVRALAFEPLEARAVPATITVLNTDDAGPGSLRDAVGRANAMPGLDTIDFAPTVRGTITLLKALPDL